MTSTPWLEVARGHLGVREIAGAQDNPVIIQFFRDCGHPWVEHDETAWCAAFVGACLKACGYPIPPVNQNLMARSYLSYGTKVEAADIRAGDIGIWPRGKAPFGHVAIIDEVDQAMGTVRVIGGNQRNSVSFQTSSIKGALGFRRPVAPTVSALRNAGSSEIKLGDAVQKAGAAATVGSIIATGAQTVADAAPTAVSATEVIRQTSDTITLGDRLVRAATALGEAIVHAPWIVAILGIGLGAYAIGHHIKTQRVKKAASGVPIAAEVARLTGEAGTCH